MSETRATPLYCPYCGDEDLRPNDGTVGGGPDGAARQHAAWECRSCLRVFAVRMIGLLTPAAAVGVATTAVTS